MSPNSLFIFPYSKPLDSNDLTSLKSELSEFLSDWNAHGNALDAAYRIEENQFIVVAVNEATAAASGCSKDKLFHFFEKWNSTRQLQAGPLDRFYVQAGGQIQILSRNDIQSGLENGKLQMEDALFPVWIQTWAEYDALWKKPLSVFGLQLRLNLPEIKF